MEPQMTTLNLKTLAAGLDDTFGWQAKDDGSLVVCRYYGQRLLRHATLEEPAEYTDVESPLTYIRADGSVVILADEDGKELTREDFGDYYESDWAGMLAEMIDAQIPWRDLQKEADEAYGEWLIARAEDREAA
jgi:hypothetical protein